MSSNISQRAKELAKPYQGERKYYVEFWYTKGANDELALLIAEIRKQALEMWPKSNTPKELDIILAKLEATETEP